MQGTEMHRGDGRRGQAGALPQAPHAVLCVNVKTEDGAKSPAVQTVNCNWEPSSRSVLAVKYRLPYLPRGQEASSAICALDYWLF